jgi:hypothetical protein
VPSARTAAVSSAGGAAARRRLVTEIPAELGERLVDLTLWQVRQQCANLLDECACRPGVAVDISHC